MNAPSGPDLRDIHLPPAPSWWPPAPGWWLLAIVLLIAIAVGVWTLLRLWRERRWRTSCRRRARSHRGVACRATERRASGRRRLATSAPRGAADRTGRCRPLRRGVACVPRQPPRRCVRTHRQRSALSHEHGSRVDRRAVSPRGRCGAADRRWDRVARPRAALASTRVAARKEPCLSSRGPGFCSRCRCR